MFDGLLKSKFYCKCKSDIKHWRTRIELVRKKRNAMQKYLRNDVADLLKNGLDINAYGRAEGLLVEINRSSCYEFIDQYCEHISNNVSAMDKQRECPEDCREAVASLMFAAARFADLPELRELRTLFSGRYGNSLDCFINKQFAEKMKSGLLSKDLKLQLLQDIAAESDLDWDSKALEYKLLNESAFNKNFAKETDDSDYSLHNNIDNSVWKKDRIGTAYEQKETSRNEDRLPKKKETAVPPKRHEVPPVKDIQVDTIRKTERPSEQASVKNAHEQENKDKPLNYRSIPPPYTRSKINKPNHVQDDSSDSVPKAKPVPKSVRRRNLEPEIDEEEKIQQILNKEKAAQGQRILKFFDDGGQRDDEENMMDKLLKHYSRKNGSSSDENGKSAKQKTTNRVVSLPVGLASSLEASKKRTRSSSYQPELMHGNNGHVHPKLPDYDDFVASLAALRGNKED